MEREGNKISASQNHDFAETLLYGFIHSFCAKDEPLLTDVKSMAITSGSLRYIPDFYLPNGCKALDIKPKTIIEVKSSFTTESILFLRKVHDYFFNKFQKSGYRFLCVFMDGLHEDYLSPKISKVATVGRINSDFNIISYHELSKKAKNASPITYDEKEKEINQQQAILESAQKAFLTERISFFLGAGVSIDAKLPGWDELLKRVIEQASTEGITTLNNSDYDGLLKECGNSSIIMGRFLQTFYGGDEKKFKNAIRKALYQGRGKAPGSLAKTICKMVKYDKDNICSIITYNYDDLIEQGLKKINLDNIPVFGDAQLSTAMPIYHVHGYLPQEKDYPSKIVLSEREYHEIYRRSFHWSNVEQLHAMQRSVCFFIGMSMTDPNLRRLLDIAQGEVKGITRDMRHFAFIRDYKEINGNTDPMKIDDMKRRMSEMLRDLGVAVVWYKEHTDLPAILEKLIS